MTTHQEKTPEIAAVSREGWPAGPWDGEPDHLVFKTKAGLPGMIHRNNLGALCGYVAVPPGHPAHGANYDDVRVDVHGGLTYGSKCCCHVPEPGEPADVWWLGFDCAHAGDEVPGMVALMSCGVEFDRTGDEYRDVAYVRGEVEGLAAQLAALTSVERTDRPRFNPFAALGDLDHLVDDS
jgi:hypothetical protein